MITGRAWLESRGYHWLGGMICQHQRYFYLNIPKNASTYLSNVLRANGWQHHYFRHNTVYHKVLVILREPIDRWISGLATYLASYICVNGYSGHDFTADYNELTEKLIFDQIFFDDHTCPQHVFIDQLSTKDLCLVKHGPDLIRDINAKLPADLVDWPVDGNRSEDNHLITHIKLFIQQRVRENPGLMAKLTAVFDRDYELYNQTDT